MGISMKKTAILVAAAAAFTLVSVPAMAGPVYLWGMTAKGKTAKAGSYSRTTRVYTPGEHAKLKASAKKRFGTKMSFCEKEYMTSKVQARWLKAHKKAKHTIVLRERVAKGKYTTICDKI
jgi:hypothetical protein